MRYGTREGKRLGRTKGQASQGCGFHVTQRNFLAPPDCFPAAGYSSALLSTSTGDFHFKRARGALRHPICTKHDLSRWVGVGDALLVSALGRPGDLSGGRRFEYRTADAQG